MEYFSTSADCEAEGRIEPVKRHYAVIGDGKVKDSLTLLEKTVTNHTHSIYEDEITALRIAHWLNRIPLGLQYHVEEWAQ